MGDFLPLGLLATLGLLLLSAGIEDARTRNIANWKNAAIALLAPLWWWASGYALWPDAAIHFALGLAAFGLFAAAFAAGMMGGGDVKMIGALALWLPLTALVTMLIVMSLVGGGVTLLMLLDKKLRRARGPIEVPYGVAIAIAGLLALREPILNQFG